MHTEVVSQYATRPIPFKRESGRRGGARARAKERACVCEKEERERETAGEGEREGG